MNSTPSDEPEIILDEESQKLVDEFSVTLMISNERKQNLLPPGICRKGCIYYDVIDEAEDGVLKEFCRYNSTTGKSIENDRYCNSYERRDEFKIEGVLYS